MNVLVQGGGPDSVQLALDLVSYESYLRPALAWVFGNTLVCRDADTAKRVTFHPRVKRRCVTLDGDVYDPSGTLSGGARAKVLFLPNNVVIVFITGYAA